MSKLDRCQNGSQDCEFDNKHELALVGAIMCLIGDYDRRERIAPCPLCLRDSMLAIAALLHLEAARAGQGSSEEPAASVKHLGNTLAEAVREKLQSIAEARAALISRCRN